MPWSDAVTPARMCRVALVCPARSLRDLLVRVADAGVVQLDHEDTTRSRSTGPALLGETEPTATELATHADLAAGEAELAERAADAVRHGSVTALLGWCPEGELSPLAGGLSDVGGAVVPLPAPEGVDPPTMLTPGGRLRRSFSPLVNTYGTVAYPDVDPTVPAGITYVLMFGMMFGDAGHGALLLAGGLLLRAGRPRVLARWRGAWLFVAGAGLASVLFGLLYGEFFGPTGMAPAWWLAPLDQPVTMMLGGVAVGGVLLALAYALAIVNRWREGGARLAVYATSGIAGAGVFLGLGCVAGGLFLHTGWLLAVGAAVIALGLVLAAVGFAADTGSGSGRAVQVGVELFDLVIRIGANLVSFARLAAFGLTHAALGWLVWRGTVALAGHGWPGLVAAVVVFAAGNALAFALEALVAAVQALRLEFYELFSRVFQTEGRPFRPWHVPVRRADVRYHREVS